MKLAIDGTPLYYKEGMFRPICGHGFRNNNNGVILFCKKLGYTTGTVKAVQSSSKVFGVGIGECLNHHTDLSECSGKSYIVQDCGAVSITIKCQKTSCQG